MQKLFTQRKDKKYIINYPDGVLDTIFATSKNEVERKLRKVERYNKDIKIKQDKTYDNKTITLDRGQQGNC